MTTEDRRRHLLVIGAQRCGTTYLHRMLDSHPAVAMARPVRPEPKVFLSDDVLAEGRDGYLRRLFAHASGQELVLGEKSTSYLEHPSSIDRIRAVLGDPWVVVQLRDPVGRAVSNWRFSTDNGLETLPLADALRADLAGDRAWGSGATSVSPYAYLRRGRYAEQLRPWVAEFGDRVVVTFLEEITEGEAAVRTLLGRIGLAADFAAVEARPVNTSTTEAPELDDELLAELREYFREPDEELRALLGRELPWRWERRAG